MSSLFKFFGEQHDDHEGKLFWSKNLPVPFRGPFAPTLTQQELESQVEVQYDFHKKFFDLTNEDDAKHYGWVMDRIVNGLFVHHVIDRHVDHAAGRVTVYIEWSQRYAQLDPKAKAARSHGYVFPTNPNAGLHSPGWKSGLAGLQDPSVGI